MASANLPYKQTKKGPFIEAFARIGFITHAARAVRISRWAVDDWRRDDPVFAAAFVIAQKAFKRFKASGFTELDPRLASRRQTGFSPPTLHTPDGEAIAGGDGGNPRFYAVR